MTDYITVDNGSMLDGKPPSTPKKKKKGTLAKLAERKRRASDADSNFGSTASVKDRTSNNGTNHSTSASSNSLKPGKGRNYPNEPFIVVKTPGSSEQYLDTTKPKPLPRKRLKSRDEVLQERPPSPTPMALDDDDDDDDISDDDRNDLKVSQTDATMNRFRNLRMASERSGSVESLKSSPFMPKPPSTPKLSPKKSPKGEKRTREPNSSGEEPDTTSKRLGANVLDNRNWNANGSDNDGKKDGGHESTSSRSRSRERLNKEFDRSKAVDSDVVDSPYTRRRSSREEMMDGSSDMNAMARHYENILGMPSSEGKQDKNVTPRSARLPPLSPRLPPPPLLQDTSSRTMRTAYKSDLYSERATSSHTLNNSTDCLSQRSCASTSVMSSITTRQARDRNFLAGHSSALSLMGSDELDRYFPSRVVHVWVGTWNMNEIKTVPSDINDFLLPQSSQYVLDIYCVCTQENALHKRDWEIKIQETLGPSHVMFHSITHGALHLVVFIRRDLIWFCSVPEDDFVTTRAMTMVRTKGSIACSFSMFGSSYLFLNCHFTSDLSKKERRLIDYCKIIQGIKLPKSSSSGTSSQRSDDVTTNFDSVFFSGDLNFRIERQKTAVEGLVDQIEDQPFKNYENLLRGDQLSKFMVEGKIFQGFQEGRINFRPTYKFDPQTDTYDTVKARIPSYTDRILFRCRKKNWVQCMDYDSVMSNKDSDHKPVFAIYETGIKPGKEGLHLSGGQFERSVYIEGNKKRAQHIANGSKTQKHSSICTVQ